MIVAALFFEDGSVFFGKCAFLGPHKTGRIAAVSWSRAARMFWSNSSAAL
jgi:hypothetical protein